MSNAGSALMGIGSARGDDRAIAAAESAISSPLLEASIDGAHGVLLSIQAAPTSACSRSTRPPSWSPQAAHPEANIIFGAVIDDALGDEVRVTVIAAGFDGGQPRRRETPHVVPVERDAGPSGSASRQRRPSANGATNGHTNGTTNGRARSAGAATATRPSVGPPAVRPRPASRVGSSSMTAPTTTSTSPTSLSNRGFRRARLTGDDVSAGRAVDHAGA